MWSAVVMLAALPACDRVFGLTDTTVVHGDDGSDGPDAPPCVGSTCRTIVAANQTDAREIVSSPTGERLAWNQGAASVAGAIWGCAAASCSPQRLVDGTPRPHSLLHDGAIVAWASGNQILKVKSVGGTSDVVYSQNSFPAGPDVTSFTFTDQCWIVFDGQLLYGTYTNRVCDDLQGAMNVHDGGFVNNGDITSQLTVLAVGGGAQAIADTTEGAYLYDSDSNIATIYKSMKAMSEIATTPQWVGGIVPGASTVLGVPVDLATPAPPAITLIDNAIAIKANLAGELFVGTEVGDIIRVATPQDFGQPQTVVAGVANLRDFTFDHDGNIFAISGDSIIRISAP